MMGRAAESAACKNKGGDTTIYGGVLYSRTYYLVIVLRFATREIGSQRALYRLCTLRRPHSGLWKIKNLSHVSLPVWLGAMRLYHGLCALGPCREQKVVSLAQRQSLAFFIHTRETHVTL